MTEKKLLRVEYERTIQDLWAGWGYSRKKSPDRAWHSAFYYTMVASVACLIADLLLGSTRRGNSPLLEGAAAAMLTVLLAATQSRKWLRPDNFRKFFGPTCVRLTPQGVSVESRYINQFMPWDAFEGLEETDNHFLLVLAAVNSVTIPKAALSPEQTGQIRSLLRERLGARVCANCGYNLTGNASGVCPECGTPLPSDDTGKPEASRGTAV